MIFLWSVKLFGDEAINALLELEEYCQVSGYCLRLYQIPEENNDKEWADHGIITFMSHAQNPIFKGCS